VYSNTANYEPQSHSSSSSNNNTSLNSFFKREKKLPI
jgi:hypothetical protein